MRELKEHHAYQLIERYKERGLILQYVLLADENYIADPHRAAAIAAMEVIAARLEDDVKAKMHTYPDMRLSEFKTIIWHTTGMKKDRLSPKDFFGEPDDYYEEQPKVSNRTIQFAENQSYAHAFLDPPYGSKLYTRDWQKLNQLLFSHERHLEIYRWSTNWSNFFDDGHEWWGTYFWTVYDSIHKMYTVIAASATD